MIYINILSIRLLSIFIFFAGIHCSCFADAKIEKDSPVSHNKPKESEDPHVFSKISSFFDGLNEKIEQGVSKIEANPVLGGAFSVLKFVTMSENPIFKDKNHMVSLSYLHGLSYNIDTHGIFAAYSTPARLFLNSRLSLEVGGIVGSTSYEGVTGNIDQFIAGAMYEAVFNFKYFYVTGGVGVYIRNSDHGSNPADLVGSQFLFGEKIAIGTTVGTRINIELVYRHFSNARITEVNHPYNFVGVSLGFRI